MTRRGAVIVDIVRSPMARGRTSRDGKPGGALYGLHPVDLLAQVLRQIGQVPYASAKAGVVGITLVAARDLARRCIRVNAIAPRTFDTPMLAGVSEQLRDSLAAAVPHPRRLGDAGEFARLALAVIDNGMLNGTTIRLDGAVRMAPR
jgi:NAD(P)-dependent dehydrogenase (short-subunit alcohol dehydrogenase family)